MSFLISAHIPRSAGLYSDKRFTRAEIEDYMVEMERNLSKQSSVRIIAKLAGQNNATQEVVLDPRNSTEFRDVSCATL